MMKLIRKFNKTLSITLLILFFQTVFPVGAFALTSGPAQEEFASFEPVETTELVNPYSGDFTYNIPLLVVPGPNGGYPVNLAYHGGIRMDQEASWVGLGWNVNVGAINRNLRGLPDDFKGDVIVKNMHTRKSWGVGLGLPNFANMGGGLGLEVFGKNINDARSAWGELYYNNYKGIGWRKSFGIPVPGPFTLGLSLDTQAGLGVNAGLSVNKIFKNTGVQVNGSLSASLNSRTGLQSISLNGSGAWESGEKIETFGIGASYSVDQGVPMVSIPMKEINRSFDTKGLQTFGPGTFKYGFPYSWEVNSFSSEVSQPTQYINGYGYINHDDASTSDLTDYERIRTDYAEDVPFLSPGNLSQDIFSISGQGTGGTFRAHSSKVRILSQRKDVSYSEGKRYNLEVGLPLITYHIGLGGVPITGRTGDKSSKKWDDNIISNNFKNPSSPNKENVYLKMHGETVATIGNNQLSDWNGSTPTRVNLLEYNDGYKTNGFAGISPSASSDFYKNKNEKLDKQLFNN